MYTYMYMCTYQIVWSYDHGYFIASSFSSFLFSFLTFLVTHPPFIIYPFSLPLFHPLSFPYFLSSIYLLFCIHPTLLTIHHDTYHREIFISATLLSESSSTALTPHTIITNITTVFIVQNLQKKFINWSFP